MKLQKKLLFPLLALVICSCGIANVASTGNPMESIQKLLSQIDQKSAPLAQNGGKGVTKEQIDELQAFTVSITEEVEAEAAKIIGAKVPFSGNPFTLLTIDDVVISEAKTSFGECTVKIKVLCKPKKEITLTAPQGGGSTNKFTSDGESEADATCSLYTMQYALFLDKSGNVIDYKKLRPFVSGSYDFQYKAGDKISPDQYCNDNGTVFPIQLRKGKFTDFKEIKFVSEAELQAMSETQN